VLLIEGLAIKCPAELAASWNEARSVGPEPDPDEGTLVAREKAFERVPRLDYLAF